MNKRMPRLTFKPQHISVFAFLVVGVVLAALLFPIRALLNWSTILEFTQVSSYGGTGTDTGTSIAVDTQGNQYVLGTFNGTATFGSTTLVSDGSSDIFLLKRDVGGTVQWAIRGGGSGLDGVLNVAVDNANGVYIGLFLNGNYDVAGTEYTGLGSNDAVLAKIAADTGVLQWTKQAGSTSGDLTEWSGVGPDGYIYWTGTFINTATFGATTLTGPGGGITNSFIAKYDTSGTLQWVKQGSSTSHSRADGTAFFSNGNLVVAGQYNGTLTYGALQITAADSTDGYLLFMEPDGDFTALYSYGGTGTQTMGDVLVDNQDRLFARATYNAPDSLALGSTTLTATNGAELALFRVEPTDGSVLWAKSLTGTGTDTGWISNQTDTNNYGIIMDFLYSDGAVYDSTTFTSVGGFDTRIVSLNPTTGGINWSAPYGGTGSDSIRGIAWDGTKYYITGTFGDATALDRLTFTSAGGTDVAVGTMEYPNQNEVTAVPLRKPGMFSVKSAAQEVGTNAILYRYRLQNDGESVLSWPMVRDRSCAAKSVVLGRGDTNNNLALDTGETWDLFCLKKSFPFFPRTVTIEAEWGSSIISTYTVVDNEEVPYLEPLTEKKDGPVTLSVFKETEGVGTHLPSLLYVLQATEGAEKPTVTDEGCASLTPLWADKDGVLKKGETWVLLCVPNKEAEQEPVIER